MMELIKRQTLAEMVAAWKDSVRDIEEAFKLLVQAEQRLRTTFKSSSYLFDLSRSDSAYRDYEKPDRVIAELKKDVWRELVNRMEMRRLLSVKRCAELDNQLSTGEGLPDIDEVQILAMLEQTAANVPQFMEEAVKEVYDWLRPSTGYVTNHRFEQELGKRVIIRHAVQMRWRAGAFDVNYHRQNNVRALDNVFHLLDGKGMSKTYGGDLSDAIQKSEGGEGETEYFKFRCCKNGNLHLEFKRADLLAKINATIGGLILKERNK